VNKSAETILLRHRATVIEYLTPLKDGTAPLSRSLAADTPGLASAGAVAQPGGFVQGRDYREAEVLMTSRPLASVDWVLATKIDGAEAMAESDTRLTRLMIALLLVIALVAAVIIAVWRHGTSRRAAASAARYAELAGRFEGQSQFLRLVTDSQPNAIFIADEDGRYHFANREAARPTGIEADDMLGKTLASVIGPDAAKHHLDLNREALETGNTVSAVHTTSGLGDARILHSEHIPIGNNGGGVSGVLVVESDITEIESERARRERTLGQLVKTLVAVVDRRDPFAAHHSNNVAAVAGAVAREMNLDEVTERTAEIAGNLMNLGKILVPSEILTKTERLSDDEIQQVRNGILTSADLLDGMEFDGPVVETLRQLQEHWDGNGKPNGLKGADILVSARIVAVANAFVAMVSPRAYRAGVAFDEATEILLSQVGTVFERAVVVALINYLDNRKGREEWADFAVEPPAAT
ncbi:MAG: HD domain-containing phosphohydrolase, partial [Alphaproteobacteria bacterium]